MSQMLAGICASSSEYTQNTQRRFHNRDVFITWNLRVYPKLESSRKVSSKVMSKSTEQQWTLSVYVISVKLQPFTVMIPVTDNNYHRQRTHS